MEAYDGGPDWSDRDRGRQNEALESLVAPVAKRVRLQSGVELSLEDAIYFPIDGVTTVTIQHGQVRFQIGFGKRGDAIGIQSLFAPEFPRVSAKVLRAGSFICTPRETLQRLLRGDPELRDRLSTYAMRATSQYLVEAVRAVALTLERRVAHWITCCGETLASDIIPITHNDLAYTLGVRRSGVTVALHILEGEHLIRSKRARIEVVDGKGLAAFSHPHA